MKIMAVSTVLLLSMVWTAFAQTQAELNEQAKKEYLAADKALSKYLEKIAPSLSQTEIQRLQLAQNAWTNYRDAAAASESAFYSAGSTQTLVHYTAMKELTAERLQRLKNMMSDVDVAVEPDAPDPKALLDQALTSPAVAADVSAMKQELQKEDEARRYLEVVVPTGEALVDVLAQQNMNSDYLTWIKENPKAGREIVQFAVAQSLQERAANDSKGFKSSNIEMVTQFIQVEGNKGGVLGSALGQIASEVAIKPLPPYRFYAYLMQEGGMKELTEAYIASKLQP